MKPTLKKGNGGSGGEMIIFPEKSIKPNRVCMNPSKGVLWN
jgi:hypothetical protein